MTRSIRTFLLVNLLLSMTLVTSLAIIGNLFLEHRGFQSHLDSQLSLAAHTIGAFVDAPDASQHLNSIQKRMDEIPLNLNHRGGERDSEPKDFHELVESVQFQVWDNRHHLLLRSYAAPLEDLTETHPGFRNVWDDNHLWRSYTVTLPSHRWRLVVLQRHDARLAIEKHITTDSMLIMLATYPLLGIMIWMVVGRGLESITRTAKALRRRDRDNLSPLRIADLPTELTPLLQALNQLFGRLQQAFHREKRFAADAAHELRTPLAALNTQAQVALKSDCLADIKAALTKVITGVERSTHVVQQLLTLSRMVPEASLHDLEPVALAACATEIICEVYPHADQKHMHVALEADDQAPTIMGNKHALMILMRNLIDNAIRYSPEHSVVTVSVQQRPNTLVLSVRDHGPGIPEATRERVFERFYRGLGTQASGSGLGLSIVKQIADLHQASIELLTPEDGSGLLIEVHFASTFGRQQPKP